MFPLSCTISMSGRMDWISLILLTDDVPTLAPFGRSSSGQGRMISSGESLSNIAATVSPGAIFVGMSFRELTDASIFF